MRTWSILKQRSTLKLASFSTCCSTGRISASKSLRKSWQIYNILHWIYYITRNTLDCDQSNYSSRIVFSHIPIEFGPTRNSAIRSADTENPTLEPNMKWIGRPLAEISPFEFFQMRGRSPVGRGSVAGRSVLNIYFFLQWSHILLFVTLET